MYQDQEESIDIERYAHLGLSNLEIQMIVLGIVLLLISIIVYKKISKSYIYAVILAFLGLILLAPLILVIVSIALKALKYTFFLAVIVFILWGIYNAIKDYLK